ncbi:MAG TPA: hypothetical protein PLZ15_12030 [Melioribacteraceae bacterium]|nr:hypothetical protein [Melioribacteraceae bacterium]
MKKLLSVLLLLGFIMMNVACSEEPPSIRVKNERSNKANVQIKQSDGNTININDVNWGTTTGYRDVLEGVALATAVIQNETVSPTKSFTITSGTNYTIVITNSNIPELRIDSVVK